MKRMAVSDVLIIGLSGLGVEIAKNVCLAGVKSVTLSDPTKVTLPDLGTQFFLRESDIGQRRDEATRPRLAELNAYTPVSVLGELNLENIKRFTVVVLVQGSTEEQLKLNDFTHENGIKFISAETAGLFGSAFCDFGNQFPVVDQTGETPLAGMVVSIEEGEEALVTCLDETRHGLEDGDFVRFTEVEGMNINSDSVDGARKITTKGKSLRLNRSRSRPELFRILGPYTFTVGDTRGLGQYKRGGWFHQVKMPKMYDFVSTCHLGFRQRTYPDSLSHRNPSENRSTHPSSSFPTLPNSIVPLPSTSVSKLSPLSVRNTLVSPLLATLPMPQLSFNSRKISQRNQSSKATSTPPFSKNSLSNLLENSPLSTQFWEVS